MKKGKSIILVLLVIFTVTAMVATATEPPTPFHAYGWVKYSNGTAVLGPNVNITNLNTGENYTVETNASYSYYQVITSSCNVSASDVLNFSADDGVNSSDPHEVTVEQGNMTEGGLFEQNLTIPSGEQPDLVISDIWVCWPDNCTICYNITNIGNGTAPIKPNHNTTLYVNGSEKAHDHVDEILLPGETYTRCFDGYSWTYTGVLPDGTMAKDNITVCADNNNVIGESDDDNNCLKRIWVCGDANGDGSVTGYDGTLITLYFRAGWPLGNKWAADANGDGSVTGYDGTLITLYFRAGWPLTCRCTP